MDFLPGGVVHFPEDREVAPKSTALPSMGSRSLTQVAGPDFLKTVGCAVFVAGTLSPFGGSSGSVLRD